MNIAVCDDEHENLKRLASILKYIFREQNVSLSLNLFTDGDECFDFVAAHHTDILFMDIYLADGKLGTDIVSMLRRVDDDFKLVYLTVSNDFASEAFSTGASYYLLKPATVENVSTALDICEAFREKHNIKLKINGRVIALCPDDIVTVEVKDKYCYINMLDRTIKIYCPLNRLIKYINSTDFLSPHRSYFINLRHVADLSEDFFIMDNGAKIPLKTTNRKNIRRKYMEWLFEND